MNPVRTTVQFLKEVRAEGNKISWPDRRQTTAGTVAVIVFVVVTATFLGLTDFLIGQLIDLLVL